MVRWIDRLGRNYQDICDTIREFMWRGVVIRTVINGIRFDSATKDAMQCAIRDAAGLREQKQAKRYKQFLVTLSVIFPLTIFVPWVSVAAVPNDAVPRPTPEKPRYPRRSQAPRYPGEWHANRTPRP